MFKIGDRVKNYRGWTGTIIELQAHSCPYTVHWDNDRMINCSESELELLLPQPLTVKELEKIVCGNKWTIEYDVNFGCFIKNEQGKIIKSGDTIEEALYRLKTVVRKEKMPKTPSYM